ncbi:sulfite exporter TauE/SafE family protein [Pseudomonas sp. D(2018)]|uniref:sulfite exporter TauE/SafE family protein n=1 Tax=Pseudomonas sp. D(2018) TaxID=2502238 RepID=UPI0010F835DD|nr:sulfite exporter TauE/SafE family protein [Pseudomonas sp. D(2018)]
MSFAELFLLGIPAVLLTGISKGGFGGALGGIAVPLLALMMPPTQAAAIMLPILCMADITGLRRFYGKWDPRNLKIMLPGALLGVLVGTLSFGLLSERLIGLMIGGIAIVFFLLNVLNAAAAQAPSAPKVAKGTLLSGIAGFTSFVAHAGGPPIMMYLLPQQMDKVRYVATVNCFFLLTNAIKLVPYALLGQFTTTSLTASLALAPIVVVGVWLGIWLQGRVNHTWFYRIAWAGLLLTGIQLFVQNW